MAKGQITAGSIRLGDNADTSKNFVISVPPVADGTLAIDRENGTAVLSINAAGGLIESAAPSFKAAGTAASITYTDNGTTPITGVPELSDSHGCYNPATGRFTPTVAGWYMLTASVSVGSTTMSYAHLDLYCAGATVQQGLSPTGSGAGDLGYGTGGAANTAYFNGTTDYAVLLLSHDSSAAKTVAVTALFSGVLVRAT